MGSGLGVTRAAVNKAIKSLVALGLEIHRVPGRGYRYANASVLLEQETILDRLENRSLVKHLHILNETDSTNGYLLNLANQSDVHQHVCLAENQKIGRGRRGRQWVASPYSNILMSISWQFVSGPASLAGLSLAAGVAIVEALSDLGVDGIGLKWPNDLMWRGQKLGGVLVDIQGEASGPCLAVLGVGLNVKLHQHVVDSIDQEWVDLCQISGQLMDRNFISAALIYRLTHMFKSFAENGFEEYRQSWHDLHIHKDQAVCLTQKDSQLNGIAEGVDATGALIIKEVTGKRRLVHSGDVSLRSA